MNKTDKTKTEAEICVPGAEAALSLSLQDKPVSLKPVSLILIFFSS